jgi:shikimate kinase
MKIFLIGFMGSGKTSFGKRLAKHLKLDFHDLDSLIEEKYKTSIPSIFDKFNESVFRTLETSVLKETIDTKDNFVLSCGGGTPCFNSNMELINDSGVSIYIKMPVKALYSRLKKSNKKRPLLTNLSDELLFEKISELLNQRESFYNKANHVADGINIKLNDIVNFL